MVSIKILYNYNNEIQDTQEQKDLKECILEQLITITKQNIFSPSCKFSPPPLNPSHMGLSLNFKNWQTDQTMSPMQLDH